MRILIPICLFLFLSVNPFSLPKEGPYKNPDQYGIVFVESLFSNVALNDASAAIKLYIGELKKNLDIGIELVPFMFKDCEEMSKFVSKENFAIVNMSSTDFLRYKSRLQVVPIFVGTYKDSPYDEYLLLVKKDSKINKVADLSEHKIGIISSQYNPIINMWFRVLLSKYNKNFKGKIINKITEGKADTQNIMAVFFGQIDGCVVSKRAFQIMSELNPQVGSQLKVLASSPGYLNWISCYSAKFNQSSLRNSLYEATQKVVTYPAGQQLFTLMKINKVIPYKEEYLLEVKRLVDEYNTIEKLK